MSAERAQALAALQTPYDLEKINNVPAIAVGDANPGIKEVQNYLKHFGYLRVGDQYTESTLDQTTSTALSVYQVYQNVTKTGVLDAQTKEVIRRNRCGLNDLLDPLGFSTVAQGWKRRNLSYTFGVLPARNVNADAARAAVRRAFEVWAATGLGLSFTLIQGNESPDIFVEWRQANDPDYNLADNTIAHADFPLGSVSSFSKTLPLPIHYDDEQVSWADGAVANAFDIQTVAIHEIGHILGLQHSDVRGAIMWPYVGTNFTQRQLHADDIAGVTKLYPAAVPPPLAPSKFISLGGVGITSDIAVVAKTPGRIILFVLGQDGALYQKYREGGGWNSATEYGYMGGKFIGNPVAVSTGFEKAEVFVLGPDKAIYHKWYAAGRNWVPDVTTFNKVGGTLACSEGFTAIAFRDGVDLFTRGPDNAVYHKKATDYDWSSPTWENLGGDFVGGVSAVSWGPDRLDLFARKADKSVYHKYWTAAANAWTVWDIVGGESREDPVAVTWGPNHIDVFIVGVDGILRSHLWDGKWVPSKTSWTNHGGILIGGKPSAVAWGGSRIDVYVRSTVGAVWRKSLSGGVWGDYTKISDLVNVELGPAVNPNGAEKPDIFVRGTDKALWTWAQ